MPKTVKVWMRSCNCPFYAVVPSLHVDADDTEGRCVATTTFVVKCAECGTAYETQELPIKE